jgi:VanZ family protein
MKKYVFLSISVILTLLIFSMSFQSGETSGSISADITVFFVKMINGVFPNWTPDVDSVHILIRKAAHVGEYGILGASYALTSKSFLRPILWVLPFGLAIALIDEGIQILASDRGPSLIDALLFDFPGFLLGVGIIFLYSKITHQINVS